MAQLCQHEDKLEALNTQTVVISFSDEFWARGWLEDTQSPFPLLLDANLNAYHAYGLERSVWRSWSPKTLWYYYRKRKAGAELHEIQGDPNQLGGDFVVDSSGVLRLSYLSRNPTDRPSVEQLWDVLEECQEDSSSMQ